ncbi:MAG: DUF4399 domain-containing protein [Gammaproteobacteria bacterium]|nr:DUF4399 domain-containing protein [Gammaproteobacteria bacterium]NND37717.1 DUF4399 domain-containing protein [Gammaproteobacteria bacterium]
MINRRHVSSLLACSLILGLALLAAGCGGQDQAPAATSDTASAPPALQRSPAPPGATVFIISPTDGATVTSPVSVKFGISGISVAPAGQNTPNTGHHHLLIDTELANPDAPVPADPQHVHYGKGQTETSIELEPGQHTLQLVLGDGNHVPHQPPIVSKVVTITVE